MGYRLRANGAGRLVKQVIERVLAAVGDAQTALSTVTIVELTHGIYLATTDAYRERRKAFCDELCRDMIVHPVSLEIAQLAGRIEGEQAGQGIALAFEDLVIGATALHLGFDVLTLKVKHFKLISGLKVVTF